MGISAVAAGMTIRVNDKATSKLGKIGSGFQRLQKRGARLKQGLGLAAQGMKQLAIAGTGVAAMLGVMGKKAADFEEQMSVVKSVTDPADVAGPKFAAFTKEIKRLGATTVFSATEAAKGAENLKRAGFDTEEATVALGAGLNLAAADGIEVASAMNIAANTMRGFGMEASEMTRVADILAVTSASTNTNVTQLGEGLKFVAPIAAQLGVNLKDTALASGLLANAGLQGSIGGTALKNMMVKIATPTAETIKQFNKLGIQIQDAKGNMLPFRQVIKNLSTALPKMGGNLNKVKIFTEAFGLRGQVAAGNLAMAFEKMGSQVDENGVNKFDALVKKIADADGAAKRMAETRLNNLKGSFKLLGSAIEGLAIEAFTSSLSPAKNLVAGLADQLQVVVLSMQGFNDEADSPELAALKEKIGPVAESLAEFGRGLKDGIALLDRGKLAVTQFAEKFGAGFAEDSEGFRGLGKIVAIAVPVTAALSLIAVGVGLVAAPFILLGTAAFYVAGALGVVALAFAGAAGLFALFVQRTREDGQSFKDRFMEIFGDVSEFAERFVFGIKNNFDTFVAPAIRNVMTAGEGLGAAFDPIFAALAPLFEAAGMNAEGMGGTFTLVFGGIVQALAVFIEVVAAAASGFIDNFVAPLLRGIVRVGTGFTELFDSSADKSLAIRKILVGFADFLLATVLSPLKQVAIGIVSILEFAGGMESGTAARIKAGLRDVGSFVDVGDGQVAPKRGAAPGTTAQLREKSGGAERLLRAKTAGDREGQQQILEFGPDTLAALERSGDKPIDITNQMCVDGKNMAAATGKARVERRERSGGVSVPFQQEAVFRHGALPQGALR